MTAVNSGRADNLAAQVRGIAGREADPVYVGGGRGGSGLAARLRDVLEGGDLTGLTGEQLDHLERVLAGGLAAVQATQLRRAYHVREWRQGGPGMGRLGLHHLGWMDHLSKLKSRQTGRLYYRSEPYHLDGEALRELVALLDADWEVTVRPNHSDHFPGQTMAVLVSRKAKEGTR
jgi:hypothetical protein